MMTPTNNAPATVPSGFRRAIPSSSDAKVFAWSRAVEASSDPVSATRLAALPTCEAILWLMLRTVFAARSLTSDARYVIVSVKSSSQSWYLQVTDQSILDVADGAAIDENFDWVGSRRTAVKS